MAWYGEELVGGRASGELTGFQATVYQHRYGPETGAVIRIARDWAEGLRG